MASYVGQLMSSPAYTVTRTVSVQSAAQTCLDKGVNSLVVTDEEERLYGIVTSTDLLTLIADDSNLDEAEVGEYVTKTEDVVTVTTDTMLRDAAAILIENDIHHVPVLSTEQTIRGVLSTMDVVEYLSNTRSLNK